MTQARTTALTPPRVETLDKLSLIGISRHYLFEEVAGIPDQWQSFAPLIHQVTRDGNPATYGIIYNGDEKSFDYLTGVLTGVLTGKETPSGGQTPEGLVRLEIIPRTYVVFRHAGHVATVRDTCNAIWSAWLPGSDFTAVEAPWFEKYGAEFDPQTGAGGLEIWIPVSTE